MRREIAIFALYGRLIAHTMEERIPVFFKHIDDLPFSGKLTIFLNNAIYKKFAIVLSRRTLHRYKMFSFTGEFDVVFLRITNYHGFGDCQGCVVLSSVFCTLRSFCYIYGYKSHLYY